MYCKKCGSEINDDASICNKCGTQSITQEDSKTRIKSKGNSNIVIGLIIGVAIVGAFFLGIIGSSSESDEKEPSVKVQKNETTSVIEASAEDKASESVDDHKAFNIGEDVQVGEVKWRVNKAPEKMKEMDSGPDGIETARGIFLFIEVTAEQTGKETRSISDWQFKLIDDQDRIIETSNISRIGPSYMDKFTLIDYKQVNPKAPITFPIIFDIPEDATGFKLEIEDLRFTSIDSELIDLGI